MGIRATVFHRGFQGRQLRVSAYAYTKASGTVMTVLRSDTIRLLVMECASVGVAKYRA